MEMGAGVMGMVMIVMLAAGRGAAAAAGRKELDGPNVSDYDGYNGDRRNEYSHYRNDSYKKSGGRSSRGRVTVVYVHDIVTATGYSGPTAKAVAGPAGGTTGSSFFGTVVVFDDKVTAGPSFLSREVGRARGFYVADSGDGQPISVLMAFTLELGAGAGRRLNGSSLSFFGQNPIARKRRLLPISGGTRSFQGARGSALIETFSLAGALNSVLRLTLPSHVASTCNKL